MAEHKAPSGPTGLGGLGKNFLVPHILLLLRDMPIHGYELMQKLTSLGFQALDQGNFYRTMRQLEKESYVHSEWDTSSSGPAKRLYSLTEMGEKYLQAYADELQRYQNMLNQFFDMYSKMFDLYLFPFRKEGDEDEKNNQPQGRALDEPEGSQGHQGNQQGNQGHQRIQGKKGSRTSIRE